MKTFTIVLAISASAFLAGCQTTTSGSGAADAPAMGVAEQVAKASCVNPQPPRDNWLKNERPPLSEVEAAYIKRGADPKVSSVFGAYEAYLAADGDHDKAAKLYETLRPGYDDYAAAAACFS